MPTITPKRTFAALPSAERGKPVRISGDPKGENFLYCNGQSVFIRNMQDPSKVDIYTEHAKPTTVARYSPSRFYIASTDIAGKVRIWDTVNPEHILKAEYPALGGAITDLDWSNDSQRIALCGNGRERFAHVFSMDTGTSVGTIEGHSKSINTVSYRPTRPFRIVSASEDCTVGFHEGPPFKFKRTQKFHTNFVNVARFSKNGEVVLSGGADGKLVKYDGKTLDESDPPEIGSPAHKGGIYEICFSPDDKQVLTVSGDKTAKIFDVESGSLVQDFVMGSKDWHDMQLGCLWQGGEIITINARGHIIYHSLETPQQPKRVIKGHMKPITALTVSADKTTVFTGGQEGIIWWDATTGNNDQFTGTGHTNEVTDMVVDGDNLISVGMDDFVRFSSISNRQFTGGEVKLDSQPKSVDCHNGVVVVASVQHLTVLDGNRKLSTMPVKSEALSLSIHPGGCTVAVGHKDSKVRVYSLQNGTLTEQRTVEMQGEVNVVAYSPDGAYLAVAADRRVSALSATDYKELSKAEPHTARVRCVAWSPDSSRFVTAALDSKIILWDDVNESYKERPSIKAHTMSHANKIAWLDANTVVTGGQDANVKQFTVSD
ncbi:actin-interacting protein 1-like [Littorina saxatilis]|uniref:Actin-interacting protein 1 n=1 Tax=Littorina saxatilis TaxID=31220 RepID=A0AAN9BRV5_9CAEN